MKKQKNVREITVKDIEKALEKIRVEYSKEFEKGWESAVAEGFECYKFNEKTGKVEFIPIDDVISKYMSFDLQKEDRDKAFHDLINNQTFLYDERSQPIY